MSTELVSVIIPVFNVEKHIVNCLNSLKNQTFKNFELIIVNDGSTDNTKKRIEDFFANNSCFKNIKIINQSNKGVSAARNIGIKNSRGKYICFIDSDDMIHKEFLSYLYGTMVLGKTDFCISSFKVVNEDVEYGDLIKDGELNLKKIKINQYEFMKKYLLSEVNISICSLLIKKEYIENNNIFFREGAKYSEDMEFVWKILANSIKEISFIETPLYFYKVRHDSAMSKIDLNRTDGFKIYKELEEYFEVNCQVFYTFFKKYGVAKWVWSTVWQVAVASENFKQFDSNIKVYEPKKYFRKLKFVNKLKISLSSWLYLISPRIYYKTVKNLGSKKLSGRKIEVTSL